MAQTSTQDAGANSVQLGDVSTGLFSGNASYVRTTSGAQTLIAAGAVARKVIISVVIDTTFAAGDGAAPIFDFGETDSTQKFKTGLNTGSAGSTAIVYSGVLTANKALLVTATAATGTTSTGAISVTAIALP